MFIWGSKRVEKKLGRIAEYCLMCRTLRGFQVARLALVSHVYYVGLGRGETLGHEARCETCGHSMDVDPMHYAAIAPRRDRGDLRDLAERTFPALEATYAERLETERRLARSPKSVDPEVRRGLIQEVLVAASSQVERRFDGSSQPLDWRRCLAFASMFLGFIALIAVTGGPDIGNPDMNRTGEALALLSITAMVGGGLSLVWLGVTEKRRWMRTKLVPKLATAYRNLQPTEDELAPLLDRLRAADLLIGKKLEPASVSDAARRLGPSVDA